jgi:hypothetical protein
LLVKLECKRDPSGHNCIRLNNADPIAALLGPSPSSPQLHSVNMSVPGPQQQMPAAQKQHSLILNDLCRATKLIGGAQLAAWCMCGVAMLHLQPLRDQQEGILLLCNSTCTPQMKPQTLPAAAELLGLSTTLSETFSQHPTLGLNLPKPLCSPGACSTRRYSMHLQVPKHQHVLVPPLCTCLPWARLRLTAALLASSCPEVV